MTFVGLLALAAPTAWAAVPGGLQKIDTNCFEMGLPKTFQQTLRRPGSKPWLGLWVYEAKGLGVKVYVRCKRYTAGPFKTILQQSKGFLAKMGLKNYVRKSVKILQDAARNVAKVVGEGVLGGTKVILDRFYRRYPKRGLTIAIAIVGPAAKAPIVSNIAGTIARTFDPVTQDEIKQLSKPQVKAEAKGKGR
jgi:hypothetical protein